MKNFFYLIVAAFGLAVAVPTAEEFQGLEARVVNLEERVAKLEEPPQPPAPVSRLLQASDLTYLGAFRLPAGTFGESSFDSGGSALAFNPANNSLFMVGRPMHQAVAEVGIPALKTGAISGLNVATVLQPFSLIRPRIPTQPIDASLGGLLVSGEEITGAAYEYYDADNNALLSHFRLAGTDLATANVTGLFRVGNLTGGAVGGYMTPIPAEWHAALGGTHLTGGLTGIPIRSRQSCGAGAAFAFTPPLTGDVASVPLLYYPLAHEQNPGLSQNDRYNVVTSVVGCVFIRNSVLFFGVHGTGQPKYGEGTSDPALDGQPVPGSTTPYVYDPARSGKGYHAWPYRYQVWAYDANELAAVKAGKRQSWEPVPYAFWELSLPYPEKNVILGGVTHDHATGKLYVSQKLVDGARAIVHGFAVK